MRNILLENIKKIQKIMGVEDVLLTEASKLDILKQKVGFNDKVAEKLYELCGPLSVWMAKKIVDYQIGIINSWGKDGDVKTAVERINNSSNIDTWSPTIISIMDWIRIGLDGNAKPYQELTFKELKTKSDEWHESLNIGQGDINYNEENPIILDFRNEDGDGFYWADLETQNSPEECDRMGHCGRSSYGYLYSLREVKSLPGGKYKLNKSHLTAAIDTDGVMYQLKGSKNSKPKDEFHQYILPLFYLKDEDGEYFIQGFGTEYASHQDFKISDLGNDVIRELYKTRPELFESRSLQRKLVELGIIEKPSVDYNITLEIDTDDIGRYVDGDYLVSRRRKNKEGNYVGRDVGLFETILSGDVWDLWDSGGYDGDWEGALEYYVNSENHNKIKELVKKMAMEEMGEDFDEEDFDSMDIEDSLKEYDSNWDIRSAISSANSDAQADDYVKHLYKELKDCLEELGTVQKMDDTGVILHIDMSKYLDEIRDEYLDDYLDRCDNDLKCVFGEVIGDEIDKPKFYVDDRWSPDVNRQYFNETLEYRLSEIQ